jgi:hypothetical protein
MRKESQVLKYKTDVTSRRLDIDSLPRIEKQAIADGNAAFLRIAKASDAAQNSSLAGTGVAHNDSHTGNYGKRCFQLKLGRCIGRVTFA